MFCAVSCMNSFDLLAKFVCVQLVNVCVFFSNFDRWTEQDKEHRKKDFEEIFCALDLHSVQTDVIANVIEKHPMVQVSQKCQVCYLRLVH